MIDALPNGSLGVVAPDQLIPELSGALTAAGITHGTATRTGLDAGVTYKYLTERVPGSTVTYCLPRRAFSAEPLDITAEAGIRHDRSRHHGLVPGLIPDRSFSQPSESLA